ncbi:MAG: FAD-dependent oxidoreductase [Deltaproteobacteria bacterium]|nr:FAD-dependent oxidoreductase [Deltaproteobacteria bacterium]
MSSSRRELLSWFLGSAAAAVACRTTPASYAGGFVGPRFAIGHMLREGSTLPAPSRTVEVPIVIAGGGIAGLSAGWKLSREGRSDFVLLELEPTLGGTSAGTEVLGIPCPTAAHYLVAPRKERTELVRLLDELGIVESYLDDGTPIYDEAHVVMDPEQRVFDRGYWHEGLIPMERATAADRDDLARFENEVSKLIDFRDSDGRRGFDIPVAESSDAPSLLALDELSAAEWLSRRRLASPILHRMIEVACLDDFGSALEETSAWAALHYFSARTERAGEESAPFLTWPDGNAYLVRALASSIARPRSDLDRGPRLSTSTLVVRISPRADGRAEVLALSTATGATTLFVAESVVVALPGYVRSKVIAGFSSGLSLDWSPTYAPWLVANLHLTERPDSRGFPTAWDNVLWDSRSLGYSVATHQKVWDQGPTVWTYYLPFPGDERAGREKLLSLEFSSAADAIVRDLSRAHLELEPKIDRIEIGRLGHGMPKPKPGFLTHASRRRAAAPVGPLHFAHTDLSGLALFEEAFHHGVRAAEELLRRPRDR